MSRRGRLAAVVVVALSGLPGCGIEPGSPSCTVTTIEVRDVVVTDPLVSLTLAATMTADGRPVRGAELAFFVAVGRPGEQSTGLRVGEATTGDDGVARYVRRDGVDGLGFADERADGYSVEFNPIRKLDGVQYCRSRSDARLTVN
ncbi:hypothetical protein [Plantactinospora sp. B5E13]|uniref:hypothetical protein n=1 Tax=unclassified Plantactinospora TaxID=2631981 RepID=UPI00325E325D